MKANALTKFAKFNNELDKAAKSKVELKGFSDIDEWIPSGNYLLNAQLSGSLFGGYPNTRSYCLAGESGSGKTYLCMNAVREAQVLDYMVIYIDTEGALDSGDFLKFGVDLDGINYKRMGLISEIKFYITDLIELKKKNPELKVMVIIDSISLVEANKFKEDAAKGKNAMDMGLRAKELRAMFRAFTLDLSNVKVPLIFTSHISPALDQYSPDTMGGGKGPEYSASGILYLYKGTLWSDEKDGAQEKTDKKIRTGTRVRSKISKARLAKPVNIEFHISFIKGMNPYVGLQEYTNWENCGIERGKKLTEKEFSKLKPDEQAKAKKFEVEEIIEGSVPKKTHMVTYYMIPSIQARNFISKWTGDQIPTKEFFSERLFTKNVLEQMDKNIIQPTFKYASYEEANEAEKAELGEMSEENDVEETTE